MSSQKFDENDRRKVISQVEDHFGVKLTTYGSRRKCLKDAQGRTFWVLGGYEDWHGIPSDMLKEEERQNSDGIIVIAKRHKNGIDLFWGNLRDIINNREKLSKTVKGDYQFNIKIRGNHLFIKETPGFSLSKIANTPYYDEEKEYDKKMERIKHEFEKLTPEEQEELLDKLRGGNGR